jgi:hypothetical protein
MRCRKYCHDLVKEKPPHILLREIECRTDSNECCCTLTHIPRAPALPSDVVAADDESFLG